MQQPIELSICILTYQARRFLRGCLLSIEKNPPPFPYELIVVDNASTDGTIEMLEKDFPQVSLLRNSTNGGYAAPMNRALHAARGRYLLQLNPDTIIQPQTFEILVGFLESHSSAGICGPKVLNTDGTLQKSCRRGESTPLAVIAHFTALDRLFPHHPKLAQYWLSYRGEDEIHEVAGVSGSCMLIRRQVVDQIGYLDERFFAYQEDADYCFRARQAGWRVFYVPTAQIVHFGGVGGSHAHPFRSMLEWHRSYWNYYRKNLASAYPAWFNVLYYMAMAFKLALGVVGEILGVGRFSLSRRKAQADILLEKG
jgi:GT2 family glycosyltransferase